MAVGGSPSWAGSSVALLAVTAGLLGIIEGGGERSSAGSAVVKHKPVMLVFCLAMAAVGAQLVPLPQSTVAQISPARDSVNFEQLLATADRRDPQSVQAIHSGDLRPLSIAPLRTWIGLAALFSTGILIVGALQALPMIGVIPLSRAIAILGVLVALVGVYQTTTTGEGFYSLYIPMSRVHRSAPFINRNHQAGWLVMALALTLGAFAAEVSRGMQGLRPGWRSRLLWFSGKDASVAILLMVGCAIMSVGVLTSRSRSGAAVMMMVFAIVAIVSGVRQPSTARRLVATLSIGVVGLITLGTSAVAVLSRLSEPSVATLNGRIPVWLDSMRVLNDFWLTGTGFNTYGVSMLHYQTVPNVRYIEAHNEYLQLAVEGGLLLTVPLILLMAAVAIEIRRRFRERSNDRTYWLRVGATTGVFAIAIQSVLDFTLQMPGAAVMFATLLAIAMHQSASRVDGGSPDGGT